MNYHNIVHDDMLNGEGLRVTLFVSGCNHYCKGCHNPQTWDCNSGIEFDGEAIDEICEQLDKPYISGLTFSGGDPLYPQNRDEIQHIANIVKKYYPDKNIWLYTGFQFEEVKDLPLMKFIDVLCDGEFKQELADNTSNCPWVGSTNQRVINVQESLKEGRVIERNCK